MKRRVITLLVIVLIAVLLALLFFFWQSGSIKVSHTYRLVRFSTATTTQGAALVRTELMQPTRLGARNSTRLLSGMSFVSNILTLE